MKIQKLDDGTLLVPKRIESESTIGDVMQEIKPGDPEYENCLQQYNKERQSEIDNNPERAMFR